MTDWLEWGLLVVPAVLLAVFVQAARAEEAPANSQPFLTTKSTTLRGQGAVFVIDGPTVIPKGVEIGVELGTRITGINGASLEVQGGLKVRGTQDHWVEIRNVDFSPTRKPLKGLHLDMVDLIGCKFVHTEGAPFVGELTIENACMQKDCTFDVRMQQGKLNLMTITWGVPCTVRCEAPEGKRPDILVQLRSSLMRKTTLHGHGDATVRHCEVKGGLVCHNMLQLVVDGCDFYGRLEVSQAPDESFKKVKFSKCNMWTGANVILKRPLAEKQKKERVFLQKFYFGAKSGGPPITDKKKIEQLVQTDSEKVAPRFDKPRKRKHLLVNYDIMMTRVPLLR